MTDVDDEIEDRDWLIDFLSKQEPDYLYCVAMGWNWSSGVWLLKWIVSQPSCTRGTAQLIFWTAGPEWFLPTGNQQEWEETVASSKEVYELIRLILRNWEVGFYQKDRSGWLRFFRGLLKTGYPRGTIGWFGENVAVAYMESYRRAEAGCNRSRLPWSVPDSLGVNQVKFPPDYTKYDLSEGFPPEYMARLEELKKQ